MAIVYGCTALALCFCPSWCGPCKVLKPRIEKVVEAKGDKVHLAKVNVDDHGELAMEYGVSFAKPPQVHNEEIFEKQGTDYRYECAS
jgi:thiol-disulfide isomerase/thioredoxin